MTITSENKTIPFGKHKGTLWTRVPVSYLKYILNDHDEHQESYQIAKGELDRRGHIDTTELEISPHALDNASLRLRKLWYEETDKKVGLYSWLFTRALEAYCGEEETVKNGIKFVFALGNMYPTLKTVMPRK